MDWEGWIWGKQRYVTDCDFSLQISSGIFCWEIQCSVRFFSLFSFVPYKRTSPENVSVSEQFARSPGIGSHFSTCVLFRYWKENPPTNCEEVAVTSYLSSTEYFTNPSWAQTHQPPTRCVHIFRKIEKYEYEQWRRNMHSAGRKIGKKDILR